MTIQGRDFDDDLFIVRPIPKGVYGLGGEGASAPLWILLVNACHYLPNLHAHTLPRPCALCLLSCPYRIAPWSCASPSVCVCPFLLGHDFSPL